jgi:hypothetical protein
MLTTRRTRQKGKKEAERIAKEARRLRKQPAAGAGAAAKKEEPGTDAR